MIITFDSQKEKDNLADMIAICEKLVVFLYHKLKTTNKDDMPCQTAERLCEEQYRLSEAIDMLQRLWSQLIAE